MNTNKNIYLDANFLIYWAFPQEFSIKKKIRFLLAQIFSKGNNVATSCLALDEMWWKVKQSYNKLNKTSLNCADEPIFPLLERFVNEILSRVALLQFSDPKKGTQLALENVKKFRLGPRDAFHLSIMKENNFYAIVTNDQDFQSIKEQAEIEVMF